MARDPKKIKLGMVIGFFLLIAIFAFYRSSDLIFGVKLRNMNLKDGTVFRESVTKISGNARHATELTLNGREISIDLEGNFEETIALLPGYNILSIRAVDKFGDVDEKDYQVIYLQ